MEDPIHVAAKVGRIETRFSEIKSALEADGQKKTITADQVGDVRDRFLLWAGNIGARNPPESKFSLEARLAAASELLEQVLDLLEDLDDALEDLSEIVAGNRENRTIPSEPVTTESRGSVERDEAHDILDVASECIRSLLRISILIRKATPRDRFAKATQLAYWKNSPFLDQFDINYVAERYPKLQRNEILCNRLGRAITKRRQFFRYSRQHRARTVGNIDQPEGTEEEQATEDILAQNAFLVSQEEKGKPIYSPAMSKLGSVSEGAQTRPSTKASTLDVTRLARLDLTGRQDDDRSYVSASSSFQITGGNEGALRLLTLAEVCKGEAMFECPFCYGIQTISKELEWRRHAFHDLRAYVCTLGGADCDNCVFGDSRAWFDHEMQHHRRTWACIICQEGPFKSLERMELHAVSRHKDILAQQSQIRVLVDASQRSADAVPAQECPFCDEWAESLKENTPAIKGTNIVVTVDPTQFRRHVSFHQEQLALFAIPRTSHGDIHENPDGSTDQDLLSHTQEPRLKSNEKDNEQETQAWIPDPPLLVAASSGNLDEVELLLAGGADPRAGGESWADLWEAARCVQASAAMGVTEYLEAVNRLAELYSRAEWGDVFPETAPSSTNPSVPVKGEADETGQRTAFAGSTPANLQGQPGEQETTPTRRISTTTDRPRRRPLSFHDFGDTVDTYRYTGPESLARYDLKYPGKLKSNPGSHPNPHLNWEPPKDWGTKELDDSGAHPDEHIWSRLAPRFADVDDGKVATRRRRSSASHLDEPTASSDNEQERTRFQRITFNLPTETQVLDSEKLPESPKDKVHVKGILKKPTPNFPETAPDTRGGVHKPDIGKTDVPAWARWTKISRKMVNPEALTIGKERFEIRDDFVVVLRVLTKEEIQAYADTTAKLRERRRKEASKKAVDEWMVGKTGDAARPPSSSVPGVPATPPTDQ
ncbi:hypothetical protein B0T14DRAFT_567936 [Immersiella caudata]|uniref:Ankyrin repeat protein n=1 Tax=Immersiella caudata TaxID=314043 RepID=A0AA39WJ21_9PEZI|nr:hypothetical protein B0T14DRAFT_567936 [Immersiella caudata]